MKNRWAPAFTIVELIIVVTVIAIVTAIIVVGYNGVRQASAVRVVQTDLERVSGEMQRTYQNTGSYPTSLPSGFTASNNVTISVKRAGTAVYYTGLTPVQNGTLLSQICQDLIDEGIGKGYNQGGTLNAYITGCGNWNYNYMQVTGWNTKTWSTPVTSEQLLNYANTFTTSDTYNKAQETVVKNFYTKMVERQTQEGGSFPITTFWDYWANSGNGGVMPQPLPTNAQQRPYYCIQAQATNSTDIVWKVKEDARIQAGSC